ncbi:hypothetical protein SAMN05660866_00177 [Maribacter arcticus]|uniref:Uncharacterized protein n=1 Tax=Maribacter arcticus TaxID=561365 RepID=A0A1T4ZRI7_9FLAO|nr:hypothetical protein SAMN05660866_00177 [Maribacter arcticus]|tara:strand:- start:99 stop:521 length:423 start_codon:yes stop_codon:yes gene_type:complete
MIQIIVKSIFLIQLLYVFSAINVQNLESSTNVLQDQIVSSETILGVWNFTMSNAESAYEKGVLFISKNEVTYDVAIKYPEGIYTCQDVVIDIDRINFNVNIAGLERVSFVLMVEGDRIIGESYSNAGSSQILGIRQLPVR